MALIQRKTDEEKAQEVAAKAERDAADQAERERQAFLATPVGRARTAYLNGDQVFQYEIDVANQQAIVAAMVGVTTKQRTNDPSEVLNAVCREGWDLVNGSFVFVQKGQESRDKFMASGQQVAIKGTVMGYYLFRRATDARP